MKLLNGLLNAKRLDNHRKRQRHPFRRRRFDDAASGTRIRTRQKRDNDAPAVRSVLRPGRAAGAEYWPWRSAAARLAPAPPVPSHDPGRPGQGSAGPDRSRHAGSARQEQEGDVLRRRSGGAGRHHDEMPEAGRVLRPGGRHRPGRRSGARRQADADVGAAGPKGAQNIRRIEARGGVTVITKDQNASGDLGVYDLNAKTITLTGNVVVSQGQNVIHGERVVVDTVTGNARVEFNNQGGGATPSRVRALIQPSQGQNSGGNVMTIGPGAAGRPSRTDEPPLGFSSMIPKSGSRFSDKIMLNQTFQIMIRFNRMRIMVWAAKSVTIAGRARIIDDRIADSTTSLTRLVRWIFFPIFAAQNLRHRARRKSTISAKICRCRHRSRDHRRRDQRHLSRHCKLAGAGKESAQQNAGAAAARAFAGAPAGTTTSIRPSTRAPAGTPTRASIRPPTGAPTRAASASANRRRSASSVRRGRAAAATATARSRAASARACLRSTASRRASSAARW